VLTVLFGDIKNGRLQRLPYLGYSVLITVLVMAVMMGIVAAIVGAEKLVGGDLQQAQAAIAQSMGIPFIILFSLFMVVMVFIQLNLMAKRIRDMGLPGWWIALAVLIIAGLIGGATSEQAGGGFQMLVFLLLVLIPSNSFGKS